MKLKKVKFFNWANVPNMEKELNGSNIILLGENTVGKSNFIGGVLALLGGPLGKNRIKNGEEYALIEGELASFEGEQFIPGTEVRYKLEVEKKKGEEKPKLVVYMPNGFKQELKSEIGKLTGELELDYNFIELSKTEAGRKKQIEIIKQYLDEETRESLRLYENKVKQAYDERTEVNRDLKKAIATIERSGFNAADLAQYKEKRDLAATQAEYEKAIAHNGKVKGVYERIGMRTAELEEVASAITEAERKLTELKRKAETLAAQQAEARAWVEANGPVDVSEITAKLAADQAYNDKVTQVLSLSSAINERNELEERSGELTALIDSTRQAIADAVRDMELPIPGLSFDEEYVYFNGKPVIEGGLSTAETMILEARLKMAKAPGAEVLLIQRGESLGLKLLNELQAEAAANGFQMILEQVERGTEELRVEFMAEHIEAPKAEKKGTKKKAVN